MCDNKQLCLINQQAIILLCLTTHNYEYQSDQYIHQSKSYSMKDQETYRILLNSKQQITSISVEQKLCMKDQETYRILLNYLLTFIILSYYTSRDQQWTRSNLCIDSIVRQCQLNAWYQHHQTIQLSIQIIIIIIAKIHHTGVIP